MEVKLPRETKATIGQSENGEGRSEGTVPTQYILGSIHMIYIIMLYIVMYNEYISQ